MNEITLIGQLAVDPTYHCTANGQDLTRFEIRTSSGKATMPSAATAHHCIAWGPAALDLHKHLHRGDRLLVRGALLYRLHKWQRGKSYRVPEIHIREYSYLGKGGTITFTGSNKHLCND